MSNLLKLGIVAAVLAVPSLGYAAYATASSSCPCGTDCPCGSDCDCDD